MSGTQNELLDARLNELRECAKSDIHFPFALNVPPTPHYDDSKSVTSVYTKHNRQVLLATVSRARLLTRLGRKERLSWVGLNTASDTVSSFFSLSRAQDESLDFSRSRYDDEYDLQRPQFPFQYENEDDALSSWVYYLQASGFDS
ncbi:hypothetical protein PsorP6_017587 [Peronosclerospora sorghi]|uniref:Uncharacterized protein n=1 Tax=Peronosclerospora sorghi TaxID=230839 RepID=A0ACC0WKK2_9STRA|nr:hypothetical protein PsorP6_017587 [Peronosclerospora sorghi]